MSGMEYLELDYTEIQTMVEELLPGQMDLTFGELVQVLVSGDMQGFGEGIRRVGTWLVRTVTVPVEQAAKILLILLLAALFTNVSKAFSNRGVSRIGYLCVYLLLTVHIAGGFSASLRLVQEGLKSVLRFTGILVPTYCISIAFLTGSITAAGYYQGTVFLIGALQCLVRVLFLPLTQAYLLISFASCIQKKPVFTRLLELLETIFSWAQKTLLGLVIAMGSVQGFLLPAIDKVKRNAVIKTASAIPGVGQSIEGAWETVMGAAVVLKNAVGIGGVCLLFAIAGVPLCNLLLRFLLYKVLAAVAEPVTEDTLEQFLVHAGVAHRMLLQILFLAVLLFLILLMVMTRISS